MDSTLIMAPKGKGRGGKSTPASASSFSRATDKPTPKRQRESEGHAEDDDETEMIDLDPKQLIDSIFTCLTKNETAYSPVSQKMKNYLITLYHNSLRFPAFKIS